ncbi:MAG: NAD(P)/FAD-dependent oxidoreductase [Chitinophagaceae bacterium]|nr:NAD(P)/FAD-dependent oxidoreductase [Chitinophagaceae bacterium]
MKVVIAGGGFAGMKLARSLNNKPGFEVMLLDRFNYHQFQPLFYQVATSGLDASNISFPLRKAFHKSKNVRIRVSKIEEILHDQNKIITDQGEIDYDILVLATGADTNFFGNKQIMENAFPMKSTVEALQLRHRMLLNFEDVVVSKDQAYIDRLLTIAIVGGGPTGVELSGAIAEMKIYVLPYDYPEIDFRRMKIYLIEAGDKTLGTMSEKSSEQSLKYLQDLGVTVILKTQLTEYDGQTARLSNGESLQTATVIWAAGIKGNIPQGVDASLIARGNRIKVDRFNKVNGIENIYALGDVAYMETPLYPHGHPQVANVAINQAKNLANNLRWMEMKSNSRQLEEFEYHDKGSLATVGRNLAVADIPKPKMHFGGFTAWLIWMLLHLVLILGVKNRLQVFINWIYNYITYDQSLRLIFTEFYKPRSVDHLGEKKPELVAENTPA